MGNEKLYDNKTAIQSWDKNKNLTIDIHIDANPLLKGNILIEFKQKNFTNVKDLFRITFNTAFIGKRNRLVLTRTEISPEAVHKDK